MKCRIVINMGGAAFEDEPGSEVARLLRKIADAADRCTSTELRGAHGSALLDVNGNTVGSVRFVR